VVPIRDPFPALRDLLIVMKPDSLKSESFEDVTGAQCFRAWQRGQRSSGLWQKNRSVSASLGGTVPQPPPHATARLGLVFATPRNGARHRTSTSSVESTSTSSVAGRSRAASTLPLLRPAGLVQALPVPQWNRGPLRSWRKRRLDPAGGVWTEMFGAASRP
jgi:hypothetical protein